MEHVAEWQAHVYLFEHDSMTQARVVLDTGANRLTGEGLARRHPADLRFPRSVTSSPSGVRSSSWVSA